MTPHDFFKIVPQAYNLSIQHDPTKAKADAQKKKAKKEAMQKKGRDAEEIVEEIKKNKEEVEMEDKRMSVNAKPKISKNQVQGGQHKMMTQALE